MGREMIGAGNLLDFVTTQPKNRQYIFQKTSM